MARPRSPNRSRAYELWIESNKKRLLKDIAAELQVSEEQIRKWKNQDKWDKVTLPKTKSNVTNHKGGQIGNKNAVGNKGGAAPVGNKNAVTTGEFETLFFDCLNQEEQQLIQMLPVDKERLLVQEIQLLSVRERRMLKRIEDLKSVSVMQDKPDAAGMTAVKHKSGMEKGKKTELTEYTGALEQIQAIEDALTRVQGRKQRAIETLHRFGFDDARLEIEMIKIELTSLKIGENTEPEQEDDGFMDALNTTAAVLWENSDEQ